MPEKFTSLLAACAVTGAIFVAAAPATAKDRSIVVTGTEENVPLRMVAYRDLNLIQTEGQQRLAQRVRFAAKNVCIQSVSTDPASASILPACRANAWQGAAPQIDRAVTRAREIASKGWSSIAPVAITISVR